MKFSQTYPDYAAVEDHIRRARAERAVYVANAITEFVMAVAGGLKRAAARVGQSMDREIERRAVESDPFLKRSVPRY